MTTQTKSLKVAFATLGCRTNQHDTAEMQTLLEQEGFSIVNSKDCADVYVVNTCTVTSRSDYSSRLAVKKSLAINENALVVFTGCYAQMNPEEALALPGTDVLLGNANKLEIATVIKKKLEDPNGWNKSDPAESFMSDIYDEEREFATLPVSGFQGKSKAFIKVQTGCDEKCSFCTVVLARGRSISDTRQNILNNVMKSIADGYKEITLTGINLGTYGMEKKEPETFSGLVEEILGLEGDFRVRISSINPMEIDDRLLNLMAERDNLCPHLHIPLQSGDDEVLHRMRRNYNSRQYREVVLRALEKIPDLGLGADVIVGFPGETDAMFENTRRVIEELPFSYLHAFSYSPRPKTESGHFKDNIQNNVKKARNKILTDLAKSKSSALRSRLLGRTVRVLVESQRDAATGLLKGHSEHFIPVQLEGSDQLMNQIVPVVITETSADRATGCVQS